MVLSVAFRPYGKLLASASDDETVRITQVSDGKLLREIKVRGEGCGCVWCTVVFSC